jgi:hypothetical protein
MSLPLAAQFVCGLAADVGDSASAQSSTGNCLPALVSGITANPGYLPTGEPGEGVKTIRRVFHSIKYAEGNPLNFEEQDKFFFHELVDVLSRNIYGEINCPIFNTNGGCFCDGPLCEIVGGPNDCCLQDGKIRFELADEDIYFWTDPVGWNNSGPGNNVTGCA